MWVSLGPGDGEVWIGDRNESAAAKNNLQDVQSLSGVPRPDALHPQRMQAFRLACRFATRRQRRGPANKNPELRSR